AGVGAGGVVVAIQRLGKAAAREGQAAALHLQPGEGAHLLRRDVLLGLGVERVGGHVVAGGVAEVAEARQPVPAPAGAQRALVALGGVVEAPVLQRQVGGDHVGAGRGSAGGAVVEDPPRVGDAVEIQRDGGREQRQLGGRARRGRGGGQQPPGVGQRRAVAGQRPAALQPGRAPERGRGRGGRALALQRGEIEVVGGRRRRRRGRRGRAAAGGRGEGGDEDEDDDEDGGNLGLGLLVEAPTRARPGRGSDRGTPCRS